jgi:hypothetical protein
MQLLTQAQTVRRYDDVPPTLWVAVAALLVIGAYIGWRTYLSHLDAARRARPDGVFRLQEKLARQAANAVPARRAADAVTVPIPRVETDQRPVKEFQPFPHQVPQPKPREYRPVENAFFFGKLYPQPDWDNANAPTKPTFLHLEWPTDVNLPEAANRPSEPEPPAVPGSAALWVPEQRGRHEADDWWRSDCLPEELVAGVLVGVSSS